MTFALSQLGSFHVDRTEDYIEFLDKSYVEMIRVRGSKPDPPYFKIPSHLYKYSKNELCLYLKDKKNLWLDLGKLNKEDIVISDQELILRFPISRFKDVAKIVPFVKKRGSGMQSDAFKAVRKETQFKKRYGGIVEQKKSNFIETGTNHPITLDDIRGNVK